MSNLQQRSIFRAALALLLSLLLAACGANGQQTGQPGAATPAAPTLAPAAPEPAATPAGPTPLPTPGPAEFANPVIDEDFPDPDSLQVGDTFYLYATNSAGRTIQAARSTDLVEWELLGDVMPTLPAWADAGFTWAPEVTTWDDGQTFIAYFTARHAASNRQCIGVATSAAPEGPFTPLEGDPFICQLDQGGSIDAAAFLDDDGRRYLLWKNDGNCCGLPTYIYIQEVSADGLTLLGEPTQLIANDQVWEGQVVEAPTLWKREERYYLFYSANNYGGVDYAVGYAVADAALGPYVKPDGLPLLETDFQTGAAIGPGGQDIVLVEDDRTWLIYHSWDPTGSYRRVQIDELLWENGVPVVDGPDLLPQPRP